MRTLLVLLLLCLSLQAKEEKELLLIKGHPGTDEFKSIFEEAETLWKDKAKVSGFKVTSFGDKEHENKKAFFKHVKTLKKDGPQPLWIVLLGHGNSFEGSTNFHLSGDDLNHIEFSLAFKAFTRPIVLVHTGTGSAPFLFRFSGKNRICVSATSSDQEEDFTRLHLKFAEAIANPEADLDGDEQTSIFESFLVASRAVQESYKDDQMIPSEDAIIDDNGDGMGTSIDWFEGLNPISIPDQGELDGLRAHQVYFKPNPEELKLPANFVLQRNEMEIKLKKLILNKEKYKEEDYLKLLDNRIHQLAKLYVDDNLVKTPKEGFPEFQEINLASIQPKQEPIIPHKPNQQDFKAYDKFMSSRDIKKLTEAYQEILYETELIHYDWLNSYTYDSRAGHFLDRAGAYWEVYPKSLDAEACFRLKGHGLLNLKAFPELEELNLSFCPINDLDTAYIRYYRLKTLKLNGTRITDLSFEILRHNDSLTHLEVRETNLTDACSNYLKNLPLETLDVSKTKLTARSLRNLSSCSNLQVLDISHTPIKTEDLQYLNPFKKMESLSLNHLKLTDQDLKKLSESLPALKSLSIDEALLSKEAKEEYKDILSL